MDAWKPNWLLAVMGAALAAGALDAAALSLGLTLPIAVHVLLALGLGAAGCLLVWLAVRWGLVQSLKIKLLAMLHGGFVWFGLALLLAATSHALQALGHAGLGLAPLHALTLGYLGCTLIAMVTRVASGHSGRPLAVDGIAWGLYLPVATDRAAARGGCAVASAGHAAAAGGGIGLGRGQPELGLALWRLAGPAAHRRSTGVAEPSPACPPPAAATTVAPSSLRSLSGADAKRLALL